MTLDPQMLGEHVYKCPTLIKSLFSNIILTIQKASILCFVIKKFMQTKLACVIFGIFVCEVMPITER